MCVCVINLKRPWLVEVAGSKSVVVMKCVWLGVCVLAVTASILEAQEDRGCSSHSTCGECIISPYCQWCSAVDVRKSRCVHLNETRFEGWCEGIPMVTETKQLFSNPGTEKSWISPNHIKVNLRVREELKFNITYRRVEDYPVDLYFLMDLSSSMKDDKDNLSKLGDKLAEAMQKITSNFRLGFGSFVDKVAMPFVNTHPNKLERPCDECVRPYSFKNHMSLTNNTNLFAIKVGETSISANVDSPEGGFDALMQAMICNTQIGWRHRARHLLVMATDASFHIAGDGKLAGIVEPNDEICHLTDNEYTAGLDYDYPSISQLARQAQKHSITLIFAVTKKEEKVYKALAESIPGANWGHLSNDSSNVIELVLGVYKKLVESVEMTDDSGSKGVSITYKADCGSASGGLSRSSSCPNIHAKQSVTFEVTLQVTQCPPYAGNVWKDTITINPNGMEENMTIDFAVPCGCPCESEGYEKNSASCKNHGDLKCGLCYCYDDYTGHNCECAKDQFTNKESFDACIYNVTGNICNNRGSCVCNMCVCTKRQNPEEEVSGPFCECDNFSCVRFEGKICSGPEKGRCKCGKCECLSGWQKDDCSCRATVDSCRMRGKVELCSGNGVCECGECVCNKGYSGQFCEDCMTCPGGKCKTLAKCVEYLAHKTVEYDNVYCDPKNITLQDKVEHIDEKKDGGPEKFCREPDASGCSFVFTYEEFNVGYIIIAEEEKQCPVPVNLLGIVFGVIGGTVLIGIITLLIWKVLTTIHDQREFAKFEKERAQSKWERGDNPLYVPSTTTFSNPTFNQQSQ